jgi:hypothetical protein
MISRLAFALYAAEFDPFSVFSLLFLGCGHSLPSCKHQNGKALKHSFYGYVQISTRFIPFTVTKAYALGGYATALLKQLVKHVSCCL